MLIMCTYLFLVAVCHCREANYCCGKAEIYCIPHIKKIVDASQADAVILELTNDVCEDPFVLPDVLKYCNLIEF